MQQLFWILTICLLTLGNANFSISYAAINNSETGNSITEIEAFAESTPNPGKLILIGIVVDKNNLQPVEGINVELVERNGNNKQFFVTKQDGNFYFKLDADNIYMLTAINKSGKTEDSKEVRTAGRENETILRAVLQVESNPMPAPVISQFDVIQAPKTASATYGLTFKIQFGAFKKNLNTQSTYYTGVGKSFDIVTENGSSGFVRYMAGNFSDISKAKDAEKLLRSKGYERTFIVAYLNGKRISMSPEDALKKYGNK